MQSQPRSSLHSPLISGLLAFTDVCLRERVRFRASPRQGITVHSTELSGSLSTTDHHQGVL